MCDPGAISILFDLETDSYFGVGRYNRPTNGEPRYRLGRKESHSRCEFIHNDVVISRIDVKLDFLHSRIINLVN